MEAQPREPLPEPVAVDQPPLLVYCDGLPYRLRLYLEPPGPGVEPYAVDVPRGLGLLTAGDLAVCQEQQGFAERVQVVPDWSSVPRKQATAMLARTRDLTTLEHLATLEQHLHQDVVSAQRRALAEAQPVRGRRAS